MARIDLLPPIIKDTRSPAFCDCKFPKSTDIAIYKGDIHELVKCKCGEENYHHMEWLWDKDSAHPECFIDGPNVTFHPTYSQGTSIIRGNKYLQSHMIHYWEMRVITSMSGTDVMFGIGTDKVNLSEYNFQFISALGINENSWGFSYRGLCQHKGIIQTYGKKITQGCIVGVYLDLVRGYLEFYLNRKSMGIAYNNIPTDQNIKLYPMVCCTSAKSSIRLLNSTSQYESLQFQTIREISKRPMQVYQLQKMPGLRYLLNEYWFLCTPIKYLNSSKKNDLPLEDEVVLSSKSKKMKFKDDNDDGYKTDSIKLNTIINKAANITSTSTSTITATATTTTTAAAAATITTTKTTISSFVNNDDDDDDDDGVFDIYDNTHEITLQPRLSSDDEQISSEDYLFYLF